MSGKAPLDVGDRRRRRRPGGARRAVRRPALAAGDPEHPVPAELPRRQQRRLHDRRPAAGMGIRRAERGGRRRRRHAPSTSPARSPRPRAWRIQTPGVTPAQQGDARERAVPLRGRLVRHVGAPRRSTSSVGYECRFEVSGRHDRSLHGLVTGAHLNRRERGTDRRAGPRARHQQHRRRQDVPGQGRACRGCRPTSRRTGRGW